MGPMLERPPACKSECILRPVLQNKPSDVDPAGNRFFTKCVYTTQRETGSLQSVCIQHSGKPVLYKEHVCVYNTVGNRFFQRTRVCIQHSGKPVLSKNTCVYTTQ